MVWIWEKSVIICPANITEIMVTSGFNIQILINFTTFRDIRVASSGRRKYKYIINGDCIAMHENATKYIMIHSNLVAQTTNI